MKYKIAIALLVLASATLSAQVVPDKTISVTFTLSATEEIQGLGSDDGTTTNIDAPEHVSITTKSLLETIAQAEFFDGNYSASTFPAGAQIVFSDDLTDFAQSYFEVVDREGIPLVNVSNLMQFTVTDTPVVLAGRQDTTSGLLTKFSESYVGQISFDDTASSVPGDKFKIYLRGIIQSTGSDTTPKNGSYTETWKANMAQGNGSGIIISPTGSTPVIVSGSTYATGSKVFSLQ